LQEFIALALSPEVDAQLGVNQIADDRGAGTRTMITAIDTDIPLDILAPNPDFYEASAGAMSMTQPGAAAAGGPTNPSR
jgi:hypothetical protein